MTRIFIDPGHGGLDSGTTGNGLQEKDLCLELALELKKELEKYYCEVRLSRTTDVSVWNSVRADVANEWKADLFFSIHINGHENALVNGYEDFIHPAAPEATADIRSKIHQPLSAVWTEAGRANRGVKVARFTVLEQTRMAAILVENGFITNFQDAELLKQSSFKEKLVMAMAGGIADALGLRKKLNWKEEIMQYGKDKGWITEGKHEAEAKAEKWYVIEVLRNALKKDKFK